MRCYDAQHIIRLNDVLMRVMPAPIRHVFTIVDRTLHARAILKDSVDANVGSCALDVTSDNLMLTLVHTLNVTIETLVHASANIRFNSVDASNACACILINVTYDIDDQRRAVRCHVMPCMMLDRVTAFIASSYAVCDAIVNVHLAHLLLVSCIDVARSRQNNAAVVACVNDIICLNDAKHAALRSL